MEDLPLQFDHSFFQNPYPRYAALLEGPPVYRVPFLGEAWAFPRHADVHLLLRDPRLSCRRSDALVLQFGTVEQERLSLFRQLFSRWMLFYDVPQHTAPRRMLTRAFCPASVSSWRGRISRIANRLLDGVCEKGRCDLIRDFAHPMPAIVIAELMGVPEQDWPVFIEWSNDIARFFGNSASSFEIALAAQQSLCAMTDYLAGLVRQRRTSREDDLISLLLNLSEGTLDEDELYAQCAMLFFAGHETTRNLIGNGMLALLSQPEELKRLEEHPELYSTAVDELARFDSPVQAGTRVTTAPLQIHGCEIPAGSLLLFLFGAANRDPAEFATPDTLDLARRPNRHVSFGSGPHLCAGATLARLEMEIAIRTLQQRLRGIELAGPEPERVDNFGFRGLRELPVTFRPGRAVESLDHEYASASLLASR